MANPGYHRELDAALRRREAQGLGLFRSAGQAFGQGHEFGLGAVGLPDDATVLDQRQRLGAETFPFRRARFSSLRVSSMLCFTSFARSTVDADDRLPVPVLEKLGSGLKR